MELLFRMVPGSFLVPEEITVAGASTVSDEYCGEIESGRFVAGADVVSGMEYESKRGTEVVVTGIEFEDMLSPEWFGVEAVVVSGREFEGRLGPGRFVAGVDVVSAAEPGTEVTGVSGKELESRHLAGVLVVF